MSESTIIENVETVLADERAALLAADFTALAQLADRKERAFSELRSIRPPREVLAKLRAGAERNAELLAATARGLRSVTRRIAEIRSANGPLRTYGQDGRAQTMGSAFGSLERRA